MTGRWGASVVGLALLLSACTNTSSATSEASLPPVTQAPSPVTTLPPQPDTTAATGTTPSTESPTTTATLVGPAPGVEFTPSPPPPGRPLPEGERGVVTLAQGGATLTDAPGGGEIVRAREGLVFPVRERAGDWLRVVTNCETSAWVHGSEVQFVPTTAIGVPGEGFSMTDAVIVLDPGHGGGNTGAIGPTGLVEKEVNLDIARRARDLLAEPRRIDLATGAVLPGEDIPAAGRVWLTRNEGPIGADVDSGLGFRARLAEAAGATALVSIHNNASPDGPSDGPGSEVYYRVADPSSKRLAGILIEELRFSLGRLDAPWVGDTDAGAKVRTRLDDPSTDYYGVLRNSTVPTALTEGAFISSPAEEALLRDPGVRQLYAEAIYRGLVRFHTTDDTGSGFTEAYPRTVPAGSGDPRVSCTVPYQPGSPAASGDLFDTGPLEPRSGHSVIWTGKEMIVWGGWGDEEGQQRFADGAAFDPALGTWRVIAASPLRERHEHLAFWTGAEMVVYGGDLLTDGAAYDPATDTWRRLAELPFPIGGDPIGGQTDWTWATDGLFLWNASRASAAIYDPASSMWTAVPAPDLPSHRGALRTVGDDVYALGTGMFDALRIARWDGAEWESLPLVELATFQHGAYGDPRLTASTGDGLIAWSASGEEALTRFFDPESGTWEPGLRITVAGCEGQPEPLEIDAGRVLAFGGCGDDAIYDPATGVWTPVALIGGGHRRYAVWTGTEVLVWGDPCCFGTSGITPFTIAAFRYRPPDEAG